MGKPLPCQEMDITIVPMPELLSEAMFEVLADIISNVQILNIDRIEHPQYAPWQLSALLGSRFTELSTPLQRKYLSLQLRDFIHSIYFSGISKSLSVAASHQATRPHQPITNPPIANNLSRGINRSFYDNLHNSNCGTGYADDGWVVLRQLSPDHFCVQKQGLTLHIDHSSQLLQPVGTISVGDHITIKLPHNRLEDGFYVAIGNAGNIDRVASAAICLYFHIHAAGAIDLMASLTQQLNALPIPFSFSVLYDMAEYDRYDAGRLWIAAQHYPLIEPILAQIYQANARHFQATVPAFTKPLAPGLGLAEMPLPNPRMNQDFGLNRCQLVADGLLHVADRDMNDRWAAIRAQFEQQGIDWTTPYLNPQSQDLYQFSLL